jgi:hypothetical protein
MDAQVRLEVAQRREVGGRPENGRQEDQEDDLGVQAHGGNAWHEAAQYQEDRIWHEDPPGDRHEDQHGANQQHYGLEPMQGIHGSPVLARRRTEGHAR